MIPTKRQLAKLSSRIQSLQSKNNPLSDSAMCALMRSMVRRVWLKSPARLLAIDLNTVGDFDPTTRRAWKVLCDQCGDYFNKSMIEVDHIVGWHSLKSPDELAAYCDAILNVTTDDLRVYCKSCHRIKTYSESHGCSLEYAAGILKAKDKMSSMSIAEQKEMFKAHGYSQSEYSNAEKRLKLFMSGL